MATRADFPSGEPEMSLRHRQSAAGLTLGIGVALLAMAGMLLAGLWPQLGVAHPVAVVALALLPGLPGLLAANYGWRMWNEPALYLWRDGSLAVASLVGWRVMRREGLECYEVHRRPRENYSDPPIIVYLVFPKGWLTPLELGLAQLDPVDAQAVDAWITRCLPERTVGVVQRWLQ